MGVRDSDARQELREIVAAREAIEQAKGAIMLAFGVDAEQAFGLLRNASQHANVKVRVLAEAVVAELPGIGSRHTPAVMRESVAGLLPGAGGR